MTVKNSVEQFRRVCEARYVLAMPFDARKAWLDSIGRRRGKDAQDYLEEEVIRQHKIMRAGA